MDALSFAHTPTQMDLDVSMLVDTTQDPEPPQDGVVRWVASQSPNPALQALMKEAEREKRTRPSTPIHQPMSWIYPLSSISSSTLLSTSVASPWHSSDHNPPDASYIFSLSGSSSSSSLAPPTSDSSAARRAKPLSTVQRKPLASSTSSADQPLHDSARPRSSSHSTAPSNPSTSKPKYIPREEEPEAMAFIELLKDVSKQLDQNSEKKQRLVAREKGKGQERSLGRGGTPNRTSLRTTDFRARPLTKTSSASAICPVGSSTRPVERTSSMSMSTCKHESRGRVLTKTASWGAPGVDLVSGKSPRTSSPSTNLNCDLKLAPSRTSNAPSTAARKASTLGPTDDGDSAMEDVTDLTVTNTEWEMPISGPTSRTDTATYMQVDDSDVYNDTAMDVSIFQGGAPPQTRLAAPKPKLQPPQPSVALARPPAPTQRTRTGPPPLGMRRTPQFQPSQYGSSQSSKSATVPRFKPPLLANGGTTSKSRSGTKPAMTSSNPPPRGETIKVAVVETAVRGTQDADSSFDVSFDVDADALEEAMKAYD